MKALSTLAEVLGLAAVVAALALFDYRLGILAGGVVLVLLGVALDPPRRSE